MKALILIVLLAAIFRLYGLNWDQYQHLHPDERMITMVAGNLHFPQTPTEWQNIFTPQSTLNPRFFAYGSLPLYLLSISGSLAGQMFNPDFGNYTAINLVGRFLSALFDLGTLIVIFLIGKKLVSKEVGLLAALFYSLTVLPIQLSHFYAVDTLLTFFITATLYRLLHLYDKPSKKNVLLIGLLFGLALATKTSALVLALPIGVAILLRLTSQKFIFLLTLISLISLTSLLVFFLVEPFALIDFPNFWKQTLEQQAMTKDAFTFPYTLQYVGKVPYLYELENIFLWGLGPILATISFVGTIFITFQTLPYIRHLGTQGGPTLRGYFLILLNFFWIYLLIVGSFAIGFMRYMLPLYPLLILFAAIFFEQLKSPKLLRQLRLPILIPLLLVWPLSFMHIYTQPNTRVQATDWINQNLQPGTAIATEHWDDGLPLNTQSNYKVYELPMYESDDNPAKWTQVSQALQKTNYIIIASNRLYTPLQKLTDCPNLPPNRCYKQTAQYYQKLFKGELGFKKVAEFSVYPTIPFLNLPIDDLSADESFTVYDHPKVMIFQKNATIY